MLGITPPIITLASIVTIIVLYFILWIGAMILSFSQRNGIAFICYLAAAWITGVLQSGLFYWAVYDEGLDPSFAKFLFFGATLIAGIIMAVMIPIGMAMDYESAAPLGIVVVAGLLISIVTEIVLYFIFGWDIAIFFTSLLVIFVITIAVVVDGSEIMRNVNENTWMASVIQLTLDFIILTVRIFIILAKIFGNSR